METNLREKIIIMQSRLKDLRTKIAMGVIFLEDVKSSIDNIDIAWEETKQLLKEKSIKKVL